MLQLRSSSTPASDEFDEGVSVCVVGLDGTFKSSVGDSEAAEFGHKMESFKELTRSTSVRWHWLKAGGKSFDACGLSCCR